MERTHLELSLRDLVVQVCDLEAGGPRLAPSGWGGSSAWPGPACGGSLLAFSAAVVELVRLKEVVFPCAVRSSSRPGTGTGTVVVGPATRFLRDGRAEGAGMRGAYERPRPFSAFASWMVAARALQLTL